jgi:hypothetical protein
MTDTLTPRDPWLVLSAVLETTPAGRTFSSASWHDEAVLAGLSSRQIVAAQKTAADRGWLEPVGQWIDGEWSPNMTRALHEEAAARWVLLYRRTDEGQKPGPRRYEVEGQAELFEVSV